MRNLTTVKYGRFNDFITMVKELNEAVGQRGWAQLRVLAPVAGTDNQVILEAEYPDLATFEREMNGFNQDAAVMKIWRGAADVVIEGSSSTELLMDIDLIA